MPNSRFKIQDSRIQKSSRHNNVLATGATARRNRNQSEFLRVLCAWEPSTSRTRRVSVNSVFSLFFAGASGKWLDPPSSIFLTPAEESRQKAPLSSIRSLPPFKLRSNHIKSFQYLSTSCEVLGARRGPALRGSPTGTASGARGKAKPFYGVSAFLKPASILGPEGRQRVGHGVSRGEPLSAHPAAELLWDVTVRGL